MSSIYSDRAQEPNELSALLPKRRRSRPLTSGTSKSCRAENQFWDRGRKRPRKSMAIAVGTDERIDCSDSCNPHSSLSLLPSSESTSSSAITTTHWSSQHLWDSTTWTWISTIHILAFFKPLVLENTGTVARDHLALERTVLSYMRTSVGVTAAGVALIQMFNGYKDQVEPVPFTRLTNFNSIIRVKVRETTTPIVHLGTEVLGMATMVLGLFVLVAGFVRYFTVQSALMKGQFLVARGIIVGVVFGLGVFVVLVFSIVLSSS